MLRKWAVVNFTHLQQPINNLYEILFCGVMPKEPLIKSRINAVCTSCLHIFRHIAQDFAHRRQPAHKILDNLTKNLTAQYAQTI